MCNRLRIKYGSTEGGWHRRCEGAKARAFRVMTRQNSLLVVEDDLAVRESITRVLEAEGYVVSSATSVQEAVDKFDQRPIDLVLLDLNLGKEEGWKAFHALKERQPGLPIVVTSGRARELEHAFASRASGVLEKPFDVPVLLALLNQASLVAGSRSEPEPTSLLVKAPVDTDHLTESRTAGLPRTAQSETALSAQDVDTQLTACSNSVIISEGISSANGFSIARTITYDA